MHQSMGGKLVVNFPPHATWHSPRVLRSRTANFDGDGDEERGKPALKYYHMSHSFSQLFSDCCTHVIKLYFPPSGLQLCVVFFFIHFWGNNHIAACLPRIFGSCVCIATLQNIATQIFLFFFSSFRAFQV